VGEINLPVLSWQTALCLGCGEGQGPDTSLGGHLGADKARSSDLFKSGS
jgi:hypothetical protein